MYENVYGITPPRFGENAVTLPLDVDHPCFVLYVTMIENLKNIFGVLSWLQKIIK